MTSIKKLGLNVYISCSENFFRDLRAHKSETTHWNIFKLGTFGTYNDFREHVKFRYSNPSSFKENVQDVTHVRFKSYHKRQIPLYLPSWV